MFQYSPIMGTYISVYCPAVPRLSQYLPSPGAYWIIFDSYNMIILIVTDIGQILGNIVLLYKDCHNIFQSCAHSGSYCPAILLLSLYLLILAHTG
ncbi:MAG: hypothetical protein O7D30_08155 [Rickettsia endosymbiont of Ixodes persulcatus]|nr:hypothetical protein [Rickettsia endosymbiont of Ixodes persulcatus]